MGEPLDEQADDFLGPACPRRDSGSDGASARPDAELVRRAASDDAPRLLLPRPFSDLVAYLEINVPRLGDEVFGGRFGCGARKGGAERSGTGRRAINQQAERAAVSS